MLRLGAIKVQLVFPVGNRGLRRKGFSTTIDETEGIAKGVAFARGRKVSLSAPSNDYINFSSDDGTGLQCQFVLC